MYTPGTAMRWKTTTIEKVASQIRKTATKRASNQALQFCVTPREKGGSGPVDLTMRLFKLDFKDAVQLLCGVRSNFSSGFLVCAEHPVGEPMPLRRRR